MSLILEALRKVEREAPSEEARQSVVLLAPLPWTDDPQQGRRGRLLLWLGASVAIVAIAVAAGVAFVALRGAPRPDARPTAEHGTAPFAATPPVGTPAAAAEPAPAVTPRRPSLVEVPSQSPKRPASLAPPPEVAPVPRGLPAATPSATPGPRFILSAVSERDGRPIAMINSQLVHEGDRVDGAVVRRIGDGAVDLDLDGQIVRLTF